MSTTAMPASWSSTPPPPVRWRSWPFRERLLVALAVTAGLLAAAALVYGLTGRLHLALLALGALTLSLWRYFVPITFEIGGDGVGQWVFGQYRRTPWSLIRRYELGPRGVLLLSHADRGPIDAFQGLYVPWGGRRDEVLAHLHYHLDRPMEL